MNEFYRSRFTGPEIDDLLGRCSTSLQPADLLPYLLKSEAIQLYVAKEAGKGLSTNDFTTELKTKLVNAYTNTEIDQAIISATTYKPITFLVSRAITRALVNSTLRKKGFMTSYTDSTTGQFFLEVYMSSETSDAEWVRDTNWKRILPASDVWTPKTPGVYVMDASSVIMSDSDWEESLGLTGFVIIDPKGSFVIAPKESGEAFFGVNLSSMEIPDISCISGELEDMPRNSFTSTTNTDILMENYFGISGKKTYAPWFARHYKFVNGKQGSLPGAGQWLIMCKYYSDLITTITRIKSVNSSLADLFNLSTYYWTSNLVSNNEGTLAHLGNLQSGLTTGGRMYQFSVRAIYEL